MPSMPASTMRRTHSPSSSSMSAGANGWCSGSATPALALLPREIDPSVVAQSRLVHVDDVDEDAAICAASIGRSAGIPVTSDIERVTERTEELVAAVTIPIFAEHVIEQLTGEAGLKEDCRNERVA